MFVHVSSYIISLFTLCARVLEGGVYKNIFKKHAVDFQKPWYHIYQPYSIHMILGLILFLFERAVELALPFLIVGIFQGWISFGLFMGLLVGTIISSVAGYLLVIRVERQIMLNIDFTMLQLILSIDPIYHTTRSSSELIAKMKRAMGSIGVIGFGVFIDMPTKILSIVIAVYSLFVVNYVAGFVAIISIGVSLVIVHVYNRYVLKPLYDQSNKSDDVYVQSVLDSIQNAFFIRGVFASQERYTDLQVKAKPAVRDDTAASLSYSASYQLVHIPMLVSIAVITYIFYTLYQKNTLDIAFASASIASYVYALSQVLQFSQTFSRILKNISFVDNFFRYMKTVGTQTYPVLKQ